jgi:hypothetical protein
LNRLDAGTSDGSEGQCPLREKFSAFHAAFSGKPHQQPGTSITTAVRPSSLPAQRQPHLPCHLPCHHHTCPANISARPSSLANTTRTTIAIIAARAQRLQQPQQTAQGQRMAARYFRQRGPMPAAVKPPSPPSRNRRASAKFFLAPHTAASDYSLILEPSCSCLRRTTPATDETQPSEP